MRKRISNQFFFRLVLCGIAAYVLTFYNEEVGFFEAIGTLPYFRAFVGSFVIALILVECINYITVRLDKRLNWQEEKAWRLLWQVIIGFVLPALGAFALAAGFFAMFGYNILETNYLRHDYTLILLMLGFFNLYALLTVSFLPKSERTSNQAVEQIAPQDKATRPEREVVLVETATRSIPVSVAAIQYAFILKGSVFIKTTEMKSIGESLPYSDTLKALEDQLDNHLFFRINRQLIVNFACCASFRNGKNRTLEVVFDPPLYPTGSRVPKEHARINVVSEDRASAFKLWIQR